MKQFEIKVARTVTEMLWVTVDAENREAAQQMTDNIVGNSDDDEWERSEVSAPYVEWVEEITKLDESSPQESPWAGY